MFPALDRLRVVERRDATVSFATLLAAMAGYTMLETARDALFLASIPATRLPIAYLAVAALAFTVTTVLDRFGGSHRREVVVGWLLLSAGITAGFYPFVTRGPSWTLYALYAWGGVLTTVVLVQFWGLLASRFTVVQAKRVYPFVGAGSVVGALVGTGVAGLLTTVLPARHLLLVAAGFLAVGAFLPLLLRPDDGGRDTGLTEPGARRRPRPPRPRAEVLAHPYARRVLLLVVVSTVTLTVVDYVFKATVAEGVPADELGGFFARVYFALNVLSLLAQLVIVRFTIRAFTVTGALAVLPALLAVTVLATPLVGVLGVGLVMKGADGTLRYSLHRTASELLYVPMATRLRVAAKNVGDVLGQRGGQALASLLILGSLALEPSDFFEELAVLPLALVWVLVALRLRGPYLDLFRVTLREEARRSHLGFPDLDQSSLESILVALNSTNDREVRAAIDVLARQGKVRVIPALVLYHPCEDVVADALEVFSSHGRRDVLPITERLLERGSARIRAAALCARVRLGARPDELEPFVGDASPAVRATALAGIAAAEGGDGATPRGRRAYEALAQLCEGDVAARVAVADAIAHRPDPLFFDLVSTLASDADPEVVRASLRAIQAAPDASYVPRLLEMLELRDLRAQARAALLDIDAPAFEALVYALSDPATPLAIRRHIPRTLMRFEPEAAAPALLSRLEVETDRVVRHKILRALAHLREREPALPLDRAALDRLVLEGLVRALALRDRRLELLEGARVDPTLETPYHVLLVRLLRDLERNATEHVFQLLGLLHPGEDVEAIRRGLASQRRDVRASSMELLGALLEGPLRDVLLAVVDDERDERAALRGAGALYRPLDAGYTGVVQALLTDRSEALRGLAVYQAGVLGMRGVFDDPSMLEAAPGSLVSEAIRRVREDLLRSQPLPTSAE